MIIHKTISSSVTVSASNQSVVVIVVVVGSFISPCVSIAYRFCQPAFLTCRTKQKFAISILYKKKPTLWEGTKGTGRGRER